LRVVLYCVCRVVSCRVQCAQREKQQFIHELRDCRHSPSGDSDPIGACLDGLLLTAASGVRPTFLAFLLLCLTNYDLRRPDIFVIYKESLELLLVLMSTRLYRSFITGAHTSAISPQLHSLFMSLPCPISVVGCRIEREHLLSPCSTAATEEDHPFLDACLRYRRANRFARAMLLNYISAPQPAPAAPASAALLSPRLSTLATTSASCTPRTTSLLLFLFLLLLLFLFLFLFLFFFLFELLLFYYYY
jgi:hypothetical protein